MITQQATREDFAPAYRRPWAVSFFRLLLAEGPTAAIARCGAEEDEVLAELGANPTFHDLHDHILMHRRCLTPDVPALLDAMRGKAIRWPGWRDAVHPTAADCRALHRALATGFVDRAPGATDTLSLGWSAWCERHAWPTICQSSTRWYTTIGVNLGAFDADACPILFPAGALRDAQRILDRGKQPADRRAHPYGNSADFIELYLWRRLAAGIADDLCALTADTFPDSAQTMRAGCREALATLGGDAASVHIGEHTPAIVWTPAETFLGDRSPDPSSAPAAARLADLLRTLLATQDSVSLRQLLDTGSAALQRPTLDALRTYLRQHPRAQWPTRSELPDAVARVAASADPALHTLARELAERLPTLLVQLHRRQRAAEPNPADLQRYQEVCTATADWWGRCLDQLAAREPPFFRPTAEQLATFRAALLARLPAAVHEQGDTGVVLRSDYGPKGLLKDAADAAGIPALAWPDKAETETTPTRVRAWRDREAHTHLVYQQVRWRATDLGPACSVPDLAYILRLGDAKPLYARIRSKEISATHVGDRLYVPRAWLVAHYPVVLHRAGALPV
jgi:hypothetical protein